MEELLVDEVLELLENDSDKQLKTYLNELNISDVEHLIDELPQYAVKFIETLSIKRAVNVFRILDFPTQERIIKKLQSNKLTEIVRQLPPDDRTALLGELKGDAVKKLLVLLPDNDRIEALHLLGYKEDSVGRMMTPDFIAVKIDWTVSRVLSHIRRYGKNSETIDVVYVIDKEGVLLDDIRIREILLADPAVKIGELTDNRLISLKVNDPQEEAINVFKMNNRVALPVIDDQHVLLGIVTIDDILWIAHEEYSEDIQKMGGTQALDEPYLDVPVFELYKKRVVWLIVLFFGELLTIAAMSGFEDQIAKVVILATFIPLIISSGGNSGSQAATLIIQAMALGEVTIKDWWNVLKREIFSGVTAENKAGFALVKKVERDSPAWKAGFTSEDLIVAVNGLQLKADLAERLKDFKAGDKVQISYFRQGRLQHQPLVLADQAKGAGKVVPMAKPSRQQKAMHQAWLGVDL